MLRVVLQIIAVVLLVSTAHADSDRKLESDIVVGKRYSFHSETLDEDHQYRVILPPDEYDQNRSRTYPVIYVLDGYDRHSLTTYQLASNYWRFANSMPAAIVVGIPSNNRTRDYTAVHSTVGLQGDERPELGQTGGAAKYREFFRQEFIPHIEKHYRTNGHNILIGHSFAGHFAINDMLSEDRIFHDFIAIDPSLWFGDRFLQRKLAALQKGHSLSKGSLYMSSALRGIDTLNMEQHEATRSKASLFEDFTALLMSRQLGNFSVRMDKFAREDHVSVITKTISRGLAHVFEGYLPLQDEKPERSLALYIIQKEIVKDPSILTKHFQAFSEKIGVNYPPEERLITAAGVMALSEDKLDEAFELIQMGLEYYPEHPTMWYGLAEYHEKRGNVPEALVAYQKVAHLSPEDAYAQGKIEELSKGVQ